MSKISISFVALGVAAVMGWAGVTQLSHAGESTSPEWTVKMRSLFGALSEILPVIYGADDSSRSAQAKFRDSVDKLAKTAHLADFNHGRTATQGVPDADPTIAMLGELFERDARRAAEELKKGNRSYAKSVLRGLPGYCISCHTRDATGPGVLAGQDLAKLGLNEGTLEHGQFLVATRQYDAAQSSLAKLLVNSVYIQAHPMDWERGIRLYLALAVRVLQDSALAKSIAQSVASSSLAPQYLRGHAMEWSASVDEWSKEPKRQMTSPQGLAAEARLQLSRARQKQRYPMDRAAEVDFLRASITVHELMRKAEDPKAQAEGFYLAGVTYEVLPDLGLWTLPEKYYEICIRRAPHTEISRACYSRFEENTYVSFSGSSGVSVPESVRKQLGALKAMAL